MIGARPIKEGTGRIARFELVPLSEMGGRPRVDVLCNMSGIFRDSFQNVVELLDDCFQVGGCERGVMGVGALGWGFGCEVGKVRRSVQQRGLF